MQVVIGIDGGGTKTLGRAIAIELNRDSDSDEQALQNAKILAEHKVGPCALTNDFASSSANLIMLIKTLLQRTQADINSVTIVAGLSGAESHQLNNQIRQHLVSALDLNSENLIITSDAKTSLYGAMFGFPVICVALGTGSVASRLDKNGDIQRVGGWGFTIGDEGGAAFLGKLAVRKTLWEFDLLQNKQSSKSLLATHIQQHIGEDRESILHWLRNANATKYGELAPIVTGISDKCDQAADVMKQHAEEVIALINALQSDIQHKIVLIGGLAKVTIPFLPSKIRDRLESAKGDSLDGACLLAVNRVRDHT